MSGSDTHAYRVKQILHSLPGKKGIDVPEDVWQRIHDAASGITQSVWGRWPEPAHYQHLYENNMHDAESVRRFYENMQHPHVPSIKVGDYETWSRAAEQFQQHGDDHGNA